MVLHLIPSVLSLFFVASSGFLMEKRPIFITGAAEIAVLLLLHLASSSRCVRSSLGLIVNTILMLNIITVLSILANVYNASLTGLNIYQKIEKLVYFILILTTRLSTLFLLSKNRPRVRANEDFHFCTSILQIFFWMSFGLSLVYFGISPWKVVIALVIQHFIP